MSCPMHTNDLYRESFKYFKNYDQTSSSNANRKVIRRKLGNTAVAVQGPVVVDGSKEATTEPLLRNGEGESERSDDSEVDSDVISAEDILLRYPEEKDEGGRLMGSVLRRTVYDTGCNCYQMWGLRSPETWNVVELTFPPGLIVIKNPFTPTGQRYWISRTLLDFPHHPHYITNMDNLNRLEKKKKGEPMNNFEDFKLDTCSRNFYKQLRWVTFGYHHDWDTKVYTEERRSNFPEDLADMTKYISQILGFIDFEAEAAIANYYHMDSTLSGHVDRSEVNQYAPLFSLSFGQTAIFLIGGKTKEERPQPVLLQSGDIAVMSGESRLSYHGVPKILPASMKSWDMNEEQNTQNGKVKNADKLCKRPKLDNNAKKKSDNDVSSISHVHNCTTFTVNLKDPDVWRKLNSLSWTQFLDKYIKKSRINLNIRQVLFPGQSNLYSNPDAKTK